ncbi:BMP family ABC transporter substrate-binding protein [Mycoplasma sp. 1012]
MKLSKKLLLGLGGTLTGFATLATVVSCGDKNNYYTTDYSGIKKLVEQKAPEIKKAIADKNAKELKITLLTAGGNVNDKSFNQSAWEAISQLSFQTESKANKYVLGDSSNLEKSYNSLLTTDSNVWVLTGFQQSGAFSNWYKVNKDKFNQKGIIVIAIDWDLQDSELPSGRFISLNYNTDEAGWIAGYATADYFSTKETDDAKRKVAAFGGGLGAGVTDFIAGYLTGIKYYNANNPKVTKLTADTLTLDTGFKADSTSTPKVNTVVTTGTPKVVLPVAGSLTSTTIDQIQKSNKGQFVIGVDTDQSLTFEASKTLFFTSIEKRIGNTLFRVLADLFTKKGASSDIISTFAEGTKNAHVKLGYWDDFVGLAKSQISDKAAADASLDKAAAKFKELVKKEHKATAKTLLSIPVMDPAGAATNQTELDKLAAEINKQTGKAATTEQPTPPASGAGTSQGGANNNPQNPSGGNATGSTTGTQNASGQTDGAATQPGSGTPTTPTSSTSGEGNQSQGSIAASQPANNTAHQGS